MEPRPSLSVETEEAKSTLPFLGEKTKAKKILEKRPVDRSYQDVQLLQGILERVKFFEKLSKEQRAEICRAILYQKVPAGTSIFKQGDLGTTFYIVLSGSVIVTQKDANGYTNPLTQLSEGDTFGELALVNACPRSATVTSREVTEVLVLEKQEYDAILKRSHEREQTAKLEFLQSVWVFQSSAMNIIELQAISYIMTHATYPRNKVIVREGEDADEIFFIKAGECRVVKMLAIPSASSTDPEPQEFADPWATTEKPLPSPLSPCSPRTTRIGAAFRLAHVGAPVELASWPPKYADETWGKQPIVASASPHRKQPRTRTLDALLSSRRPCASAEASHREQERKAPQRRLPSLQPPSSKSLSSAPSDTSPPPPDPSPPRSTTSARPTSAALPATAGELHRIPPPPSSTLATPRSAAPPSASPAQVAVEINTLMPYDYFGEVALLNKCKRTATVISKTHVEVYILSKWDFLRRCNKQVLKLLRTDMNKYPSDCDIRRAYHRHQQWTNFKRDLVASVAAKKMLDRPFTR